MLNAHTGHPRSGLGRAAVSKRTDAASEAAAGRGTASQLLQRSLLTLYHIKFLIGILATPHEHIRRVDRPQSIEPSEFGQTVSVGRNLGYRIDYATRTGCPYLLKSTFFGEKQTERIGLDIVEIGKCAVLAIGYVINGLDIA